MFGLALFYIIYLLFILLFQGTGTLYSTVCYHIWMSTSQCVWFTSSGLVVAPIDLFLDFLYVFCQMCLVQSYASLDVTE